MNLGITISNFTFLGATRASSSTSGAREGICLMGEFKKRARLDMKAEGHIPGPLQQKFTPQLWEKAFKECGDPDDEDLNIYEAALLPDTACLSGTKAAPARSTVPCPTQSLSSAGCPQCARPAMQVTVWIDRGKRRLHDGHGNTRWRTTLRT